MGLSPDKLDVHGHCSHTLDDQTKLALWNEMNTIKTVEESANSSESPSPDR